jgi:hypothetical protein
MLCASDKAGLICAARTGTGSGQTEAMLASMDIPKQASTKG